MQLAQQGKNAFKGAYESSTSPHEGALVQLVKKFPANIQEDYQKQTKGETFDKRAVWLLNTWIKTKCPEVTELPNGYDVFFPKKTASNTRDGKANNLQDFENDCWDKLGTIEGCDSDSLRVDRYGNVVGRISKDVKVRRFSALAFAVDHFIPDKRNGPTEMFNLELVQWKANLAKSDKPPWIMPQTELKVGITVTQLHMMSRRGTFYGIPVWALLGADLKTTKGADGNTLWYSGDDDALRVRQHANLANTVSIAAATQITNIFWFNFAMCCILITTGEQILQLQADNGKSLVAQPQIGVVLNSDLRAITTDNVSAAHNCKQISEDQVLRLAVNEDGGQELDATLGAFKQALDNYEEALREAHQAMTGQTEGDFSYKCFSGYEAVETKIVEAVETTHLVQSRWCRV